MSFREVTDLSADTAITLGGFNKKARKDNPTYIEGYYLGKREITNKLGTAQLHFFQTGEGNVGVWGKTDLNRKLAGVTVGTMTRATFDRMAPTPTGEMYKYKVQFDADNTIDVAGIELDADPAAEGDDYRGADADATSDTGYGYSDTAPAQVAHSSLNRVQDLLNKNKGSATKKAN